MGTIKRESAIRAFSIIMVLTMLISIVPLAASATTGKTAVPGKVYEFDKDGYISKMNIKLRNGVNTFILDWE